MDRKTATTLLASHRVASVRVTRAFDRWNSTAPGTDRAGIEEKRMGAAYRSLDAVEDSILAALVPDGQVSVPEPVAQALADAWDAYIRVAYSPASAADRAAVLDRLGNAVSAVAETP